MRIIKFTKSKENKAIKVILFFSGLAIVSLFFLVVVQVIYFYILRKRVRLSILKKEKKILC